MTIGLRKFAAIAPVLAAIVLSGCVSANKFDALDAKYQQLLASYTSDQAEIQKLDGRLKVTFRDQILFPEGGFRLTTSSEATLAKLVPVLTGLQQTKVVVDGYTDNVPIGPELQRDGIATNFDLSSRRADGVVDYLRRQGINPSLLSAQGFGATNPVASNDTAEGRAKNRRIEVSLVGPGT